MSRNCKQPDQQTFNHGCKRARDVLPHSELQQKLMPSDPRHKDTRTRITWSLIAGSAMIFLVLIILTIHAIARTTA
jgi:hypothetical protein